MSNSNKSSTTRYIGIYIPILLLMVVNFDLTGLKAQSSNMGWEKHQKSDYVSKGEIKGEIIIHAVESEKGDEQVLGNDRRWGWGTVGVVYLGYVIKEDGWVVLGNDFLIGAPLVWIIRSQLKNYLMSLGSLSQIEARVEYLDQMGRPVQSFISGETGRIMVTIINRGSKKVNNLKPFLDVKTKEISEFPAGITLQNVMVNGRKPDRSYTLNPKESLTMTGIVHVPLAFTGTGMEVLASVSPNIKGMSSIKVVNPNPPDLILADLVFNDQDGNEILDGLESGKVSVAIINQGNGSARNIRIYPTITNALVTFGQQDRVIIELMPGGREMVSFDVKAAQNVEDGTVLIRIDGAEGRGFDARAIQAEISTAHFIAPDISVSNWRINDGQIGMADGNNNRLIENGETAEVIFEIRNKGQGPAYGCQLTPVVRGLGVIPLNVSVPLGLIAPGGSVSAPVAITVPISYENTTISMDLNIRDERGAVDFTEVVSLESYYRKPELDFDYLIYDGNSPGSRGNQNGIIEQGENIELEILPQNMGDYQAVDVTFRLAIDYPGIIKPPTFRNEFLSVGKIPEKMNGNPVRFPLTIQRSAKPGSFTALVEMDQANFKGLKREITFDLEEEKIETVAFGQRQSSGFGRFGDREAEGIINVDVAPNLGKRARNAVAVVIGNRNYRIRGVPSVDYAERDARIFKSYLTRTLGLSESDVMYFTDASFTDFNEIFGTQSEYRGKLYSRVKSGTKVYVFYSGHGAPDVEEGTGYFVPSDSDPSKIKLTGYPVGLMKRNLAKLPTDDITVVIDACFSGQSDKGDFLIKGISPAMLKLKDPEVIRGVSVFSAATKNQVSSWYNDARHGVFTYYFLAGMQGLADKDGDRKVTYGEMDEYLQENIPGKVIEISSGQRDQKPTFIGDKRRVIVDLNE